ncbi:MFS transporter [Streptomyces sp. NPDC048604]|uniref:MFS transporter n=1 Tax=Streptomyces sp. NPDC048604 TaxID=3365578 RepID=UPI00371B28A7
MRADSPWRVADFRALFSAAVLGNLGTNVGYVALPLVAVASLDAGPGEVGALATLSTVAFLLIGLPAGAWVDRMRQRRVLIVADLARGLLFASVPLAWWLDVLTLGQLYAIVFLGGCATVFFDVTSQSVLPRLVGRDGLVAANSAMVGLQAAANVAGRGAGGALVQWLTAPLALVWTAVSHLGSAIRLAGVRDGGAVPPRAPEKADDADRADEADGAGKAAAGLRAQIAEGLRHVLGNRELRALALSAAVVNFGMQIVNTMLPVLFVRELGLSAGALGAFWAVGGLGILLGSRCAGWFAARLGYGRSLSVVGVCLAPAGLLVPLIDRGAWLWVAAAGWLLVLFMVGTNNVVGVSLRQRMTPDTLLGRMNATFRFLLTGALAVGAALSGVLGELVGLRLALWAGGVVMAVSFLPVLLSPVRTRRELPQEGGGIVTARSGSGARGPDGARPR